MNKAGRELFWAEETDGDRGFRGTRKREGKPRIGVPRLPEDEEVTPRRQFDGDLRLRGGLPETTAGQEFQGVSLEREAELVRKIEDLAGFRDCPERLS